MGKKRMLSKKYLEVMLQNTKAEWKGMSGDSELYKALRLVEICTLEKYKAQVEKIYVE